MKQAPEWLGLICQGQTPEEVEHWLEAAAKYGFKTVQPAFFWANYRREHFIQLKQRLDQLGLSADAFGVYSDILKRDEPAGAVFESTCADLQTAADCAHLLDTRFLVSWCGTAGDFATPCDANQKSENKARLFAHLKQLEPTLKTNNQQLLFEPWRDHILGDEHMTAEACRLNPERLGVVLDPPNFISPEQWPNRTERVSSIVAALTRHIGIIHLKDMLVNEDSTVELPVFGRGELTQALANSIRPFIGKHPVIAEHMTAPDDLPELLENVQRYFNLTEA